jgi:hypothetical protein
VTQLEWALRCATSGVIFDTNLLLMFLVGLWNPRRISTYKRTAAYSEEDHALLLQMVQRTGMLVTTPHILTEVCNLADTLNRENHLQVYGALAALQATARERRQEATRLMQHPLFTFFGIADSSLIDASLKGHLVVTDEAACYAAILRCGGLGLNLNHLRGAVWLVK